MDRSKDKQCRHVALLVETSLASGRDILRGIARYIREHETWALYHEARSLEECVPSWLKQWKGDGIIARLQNRMIVEEVKAVGIPVVDVLGVVKDAGFPLVHVDDNQIARMAADHLMERGFRYFGFLGIEGENWSDMRRKAFYDCIQKAGLECRDYAIPRGISQKSSWEGMEDSLANWVRSLPKPAGVMVCSDQLGPQLLEACRRAGVRVPDEVAVVGVDNDEPLCEVANPSLSSIIPNHFMVGYEAAALLDRLMAGGMASQPDPIFVNPQRVVTRVSSDVLAIEDRKMAEALRVIRETACDGLSVDALARQVGLSRSVLQRRFRQTMNRSIHQEIVNVRMKRACELLVETDLALADIAERAGFKHQEYMGVVFKSRLKKTPAQYRRAGRK